MNRQIPIDPVLEKGYDVRMLRDDFAEISNAWIERSSLTRKNANVSLDCSYDIGPANKIDIFRSGEIDAPLYVFIHGGYWQRGDKSVYSFVSESFLNNGIDVALIGYQLCPDASMTSITDQMRKALMWLWNNAEAMKISRDRINVSGHSAGGHLTAMMLATDWQRYNAELPANLIKTGIPISGLYQLEPLQHTTISDALKMNSEELEYLSPHFLKPSSKAPVLVTIGGAETKQFHFQSDEFICTHPPQATA